MQRLGLMSAVYTMWRWFLHSRYTAQEKITSILHRDKSLRLINGQIIAEYEIVHASARAFVIQDCRLILVTVVCESQILPGYGDRGGQRGTARRWYGSALVRSSLNQKVTCVCRCRSIVVGVSGAEVRASCRLDSRGIAHIACTHKRNITAELCLCPPGGCQSFGHAHIRFNPRGRAVHGHFCAGIR